MRYYVFDEGQNQGPFSRDQIVDLFQQGKMTGTLPCCAEGAPAWSTVAEVAGSAPFAAAVPEGAALPAWCQFESYLLRRKVFSFLGASFHMYGPTGNLVCYSKQKAFKLREDIRIYSDESMSTEILSIKARQIMDFSAAYDVVDGATQQRVGALRRKGFSSMLRDSWQVLDVDGNEVGQVTEDNMAMALLRRTILAIIPQQFHLQFNGKSAAEFHQQFNPFIYKLKIKFVPESGLDRRLGLAAAILLAAVEGRQQ